jgi:hypothetical protein
MGKGTKNAESPYPLGTRDESGEPEDWGAIRLHSRKSKAGLMG